MSTNGNLTEDELILFTQKFLRETFPNVQPVRYKITPQICAWALSMNYQMIAASAGISFFESIWKGTLPGTGNFKSIRTVLELLKDSAKDAVKSYLNGEIKTMVQNTVRANWRSTVDMYFKYDDVGADTDFEVKKSFRDAVNLIVQ